MTIPQGSGSFQAIALAHLDAAYNFARWLMQNEADADDVLQEAMLRALTYFSGFRGGDPRGWLLRIVRNAAYDLLRSNRSLKLVPIAAGPECDGNEAEAVKELADPADDPESALIRARVRHEADRLVASLPPELREVIVLRELEQFSYSEIARITEVPIGTVMSRLWRGRRVLEAAAAARAKAESA